MDSCFAVHRDGRDFKCGTMLTIPVLVGYSEVIPPQQIVSLGPTLPKQFGSVLFLLKPRTVLARRSGQVSNLPRLLHTHPPPRSCYRDCLDNPNPNLKEWSDQSG